MSLWTSTHSLNKYSLSPWPTYKHLCDKWTFPISCACGSWNSPSTIFRPLQVFPVPRCEQVRPIYKGSKTKGYIKFIIWTHYSWVEIDESNWDQYFLYNFQKKNYVFTGSFFCSRDFHPRYFFESRDLNPWEPLLFWAFQISKPWWRASFPPKTERQKIPLFSWLTLCHLSCSGWSVTKISNSVLSFVPVPYELIRILWDGRI